MYEPPLSLPRALPIEEDPRHRVEGLARILRVVVAFEIGAVVALVGLDRRAGAGEKAVAIARLRHRQDHRLRLDADRVVGGDRARLAVAGERSEEHTSELQSPLRRSSADFCLEK